MQYYNKDDILELEKLESIYSTTSLLCYALSAGLIFKRNVDFRMLYIYFGAHLFVTSNIIGMYLVKDKYKAIRRKIPENKKFKSKLCDLFDETLIPDWKTYLYYFNIL